MTEPLEWQRTVVAGTVAIAAVLAGVALRAVLSRLARRAGRTRWEWDDLIFALLRDLALVTTTAAGLWASVLVLGLKPGVRDVTGRALVAAVILTVSIAVGRFAAGGVASVAHSRGVAQSATIFKNLARVVIIGIGLLVLLESLGISITPLLTALGVGGLAVALALQDTLANLFAGVHILASKKVLPGDYVRLDGGGEGYIVDINWHNTTIRQLRDNLIIVPNSRFADAIVTNFHRPAQALSIPVQVGVSYDSDLDEVERVTVEVAHDVMKALTGGVTEYQPKVRFHTFGESRIDFSVTLRTHEFADQYLVVHEFIKRLHQRYRAEGIEIPLPIRTLVTPDRQPAITRS